MLHPCELSRDFLIQMAREHELSPEQAEVFVARFSEDSSYDELAEKLHTSKDACLKRMSEAYKKFSIAGDTRGKESRLRIVLLQKSRLSQNMILPEPQDIKNLKADIDALKLQVASFTSHRQWSPLSISADNPKGWIEELQHEIQHSAVESIQRVLEEFAAQLPIMIRTVAARSSRTEQDLALDILSNVALVFQSGNNGLANSEPIAYAKSQS